MKTEHAGKDFLLSTVLLFIIRHRRGCSERVSQEALNKLYEKFREYHAMKNAREATNRGVFERLLAHSDPFLFSQRRELPKKTLELPDEVKELLCDDE